MTGAGSVNRPPPAVQTQPYTGNRRVRLELTVQPHVATQWKRLAAKQGVSLAFFMNLSISRFANALEAEEEHTGTITRDPLQDDRGEC